MKKILTLCLAAALLFTGCNNKEKEEQLRQAQAVAEASREELADAVSDRDQLLTLVNEISSSMDQIKQLENILSVNGATETPNQREQLRADIASIQETLAQRRHQLEDLEKKLSRSNLNNSKLQETITSLRKQLDSQSGEIAQLRTSLDQAKTTIGKLDAAIDSLNTTVSNVTAERDSTDKQNEELTNELNTCYYAIGTKGELKDNGIIESGFLRKTKIMEGEFDRAFFTKADKRTLTTIDLNSKKAEVLTKQPSNSYSIVDVDGHKVLQITNPALFWSLSNYLVIKID
ncbi:MAG: hypothetical protein J6C95_00885 [Muribaculaceae bacterium]|nr:hypothetical protein [Muribaculaceae bacterium]